MYGIVIGKIVCVDFEYHMCLIFKQEILFQFNVYKTLQVIFKDCNFSLIFNYVSTNWREITMFLSDLERYNFLY